MTEDLDQLLMRLAAAPLDRSLDGLEARISRAIAARRNDARITEALAPLRIATVGLALAMGVTAGGAAAMAAIRRPSAPGPFAAATQLAPSTLLEDAG
jgi:hypothetical protein